MIDDPKPFYIPLARRRFLKALAVASAGFTLPGYLAEALTLSPEMTQGPYYPEARNLPLDDDNDLVTLNDSTTAATGIITYLSGRVLDCNGIPIKDALVELWHADHAGNYIYDEDYQRNPDADPHFQGFGQFMTGSSGQYLFRTVKAGLYEGRTRHFHLGVTVPGQAERSTTQTFWNEVARDEHGEQWDIQNDNDMVLQGIDDAAQRAAAVLTYRPVPGTTSGEVAAHFDFVAGFTPVEPVYPGGGSLLVQGETVAGPEGGRPRYKVSLPIYKGYTYEVYSNPTFSDNAWQARPFSLTQTGVVDRNRYTATSEGTLVLYVEEKAAKSFYKVTFRVPGANTGMP